MKKILLALTLGSGAAFAGTTDDAIANAKSAIAMKMKDPESVRFADVVAADGTKSPIVCGWLNAKNSYGGYVGYKPFYVMGRFAEVRDDEGSFTNRGTFALAWKSCGLVPDGERFGDALLKLPKLKVEKECASKRKRSSNKELYANCEQSEAEALAWLKSHPTGPYIALLCERDVRKYSSYSMGRTCVQDRETHTVIDRGPRAAPAQ